MAPVVAPECISDLTVSSLELDARSTPLDQLISEAVPAMLLKRDTISSISSPIEVYHTLTARDATNSIQPDHGGAVDPTNVNMKGVQAVFALIGAAFVIATIWFFFWAKNGGFYFQKGDWDDYKSTVLRRKGPNGTTLSNATKSTKLGGGSIVGEGYSDGTGSTWDGTGADTMTEAASEAPIMSRPKRESAKERKLREAKEAQWEGGHDQDVLAYIREKPAQVGGINKHSDAFHYGTDYTDTEGSAIHSNRQTRHQGPRVSSHRQTSPEKRQSRRDFSFGNEDAFSSVSSPMSEVPAPPLSQHRYPVMPQPVQLEERPPPAPPHRPGRYHSPSKQFQQDANRRSGQYHRSGVPGGWQESSVVSDVQSQNTKAYHHPLPALNQANQTRGYRRDRRDSFD